MHFYHAIAVKAKYADEARYFVDEFLEANISTFDYWTIYVCRPWADPQMKKEVQKSIEYTKGELEKCLSKANLKGIDFSSPTALEQLKALPAEQKYWLYVAARILADVYNRHTYFFNIVTGDDSVPPGKEDDNNSRWFIALVDGHC